MVVRFCEIKLFARQVSVACVSLQHPTIFLRVSILRQHNLFRSFRDLVSVFLLQMLLNFSQLFGLEKRYHRRES